ncbi:UNVERIFIED_CONTAM: E3 ubiquitin-protein ligase MBR2 [Sesamum radiatum]|uniref:RING-type E3 ubiquitin transferase n=1 Tax=Sesamum radiatum TaxID=300843 RepID=A0AAW2PJ34_SESRA
MGRVLRQESLALGDIINIFRLCNQRPAEIIRLVMRRSADEIWMMVARRWSLGGGFSDAAISKYLKRRSRPSSGGVGDGEGAICVVCHDELYCHGDDDGEGTTMIARLGCGHEYHVPCIKQWLLRKNACPLCRAPTQPKRRWLWH